MQPALLARSDFDHLVQALIRRGYRVLGPQLRTEAIVWGEVESAADLPRGLRSVQEPGRYRVEDKGDERLFDFVNGMESLKRLLFDPEETLWRVTANGEVHFNESFKEAQPTAVIGARACDLAGMLVQDRTFLAGQYTPVTDPYYARRRDSLLIVAVNCVTTVPTCFCASMQVGPRSKEGFDLALTELENDFLIEAGSDTGTSLAAELPLRPAQQADTDAAARAIDAAAKSQVRRLDTHDIYELLFNNLDHPRWDDVASRCLSCSNCVMVCPTCFCHREYDEPDLDGGSSRHVRRWDACYTLEHGSTHGAYLRPQVKQRYRQWLTHKVGAWVKQFGVSGCVGCGRCITWCPTGIDLTEEIAAIRATPGQRA
jgi:ferredoxin